MRIDSLEIRRAGSHDAEFIALLGRITFAETFGHLFVSHAADLRAYLDRTFAVSKLRHSLEQTRNAYWLAMIDELPVGYAKLKTPSPINLLGGEHVAQLQKIYVLREFLGQGIGKPLFEAVLEHATAQPIGALWLDVLKENRRAIGFYERLGFAALGEDTYSIGAQTFLFHLMVLRAPFSPT
jgi:ribosomal protein S18 acetylase RimI-like enzyme